jgi:argininosuccinate synthase
MGRDEEIAYAREHGIPSRAAPSGAVLDRRQPLGALVEGKWIEDLSHAPDDDVFQLVTRPEEAPDEAQTVVIGFERGVPVSVDGTRMGLVELIDHVAELGCRHGIGIVDHIETASSA